MPWHTFKAPDTNLLKSDKSLRGADVGDGCLARSTDIPGVVLTHFHFFIRESLTLPLKLVVDFACWMATPCPSTLQEM